MPLLPGKTNIGHNIKEMEKAGHPQNQAVAAALSKAGVAKAKDQEQVADPVPGGYMPAGPTVAEIQAKNRQFWEADRHPSIADATAHPETTSNSTAAILEEEEHVNNQTGGNEYSNPSGSMGDKGKK